MVVYEKQILKHKKNKEYIWPKIYLLYQKLILFM